MEYDEDIFELEAMLGGAKRANVKAEVLEDERDTRTLFFSGRDMDVSIVNTIKRVMQSSVATYTFPPDNINISKNDTIYDNDRMRLRLSQFLVPDIPNGTIIYDGETDNEFELEMTLRSRNDTDEVMNVTSDQLEFTMDGETFVNKFQEYYDRPLLIIKLRPGEEFNFQAKAMLGTAKHDAIWSACTLVVFDEVNNGFQYYYETHGQLSPQEVFDKTCQIIIQKLEDIEASMGEMSGNSKGLIMTLDNEDYTMGNLLNVALAKHPLVKFSGYKKDTQLKNEVVIRTEVTEGNVVDVFMETMAHLKNVFQTLLN